MHDHASRGRATLPSSADRTEEDRLGRHFKIGGRRNDERVVAAKLQNRSTQPSVNSFGDIKSHVRRTGGRDQRNPLIVSQFLTDGFSVAHQQREDRGICPGVVANALGDFCDCDGRERSFFGSFPNR